MLKLAEAPNVGLLLHDGALMQLFRCRDWKGSVLTERQNRAGRNSGEVAILLLCETETDRIAPACDFLLFLNRHGWPLFLTEAHSL